MAQRSDDDQGSHLAQDLLGMAALIVLLVMGLHLPILI